MMYQLDYDYGFALGLSPMQQSRGESAIPNVCFGGLLQQTESLGLRTETMLECLELLAGDEVSAPLEKLWANGSSILPPLTARHPVDDGEDEFEADVTDDEDAVDDAVVPGDDDDEDEDFDEEDEFDDEEDFDDELDDEIDDIDMDEEDEFDDDDDDEFGDDEFEEDDEDLDVV